MLKGVCFTQHVVHKQEWHELYGVMCHTARWAIASLQIDEFIKTGTFAALNEAEASIQGGDAPEKQKAVQSKAQDLAAKFL